MCGIFGSYSIQEFKHLFKINSELGSTSVGLCRVSTNHDMYFVEKYPLNEFINGDWFERAEQLQRNFKQHTVYYLGHIQAPTEGQEFTPRESHPFENEHLIWAHNGIIQNHWKLRERLTLPMEPKTDSFVIGSYMDLMLMQWNYLADLDGTFACWMFDKKSYEIFIFRATNNLYFTNTSFSTKPFEGAKEVPQGKVFKIGRQRFVIESDFTIKSQPFYIPED